MGPKRHSSMKTGEKYSCDVCKKQCKSLTGLRNHSRTHKGNEPIFCDVCHQQVASYSALNSHCQKHAGKKYSCEICRKQFVQLRSLKFHCKNIHEGDKYSCGICQEKFTFIPSLKRHYRIHTEDKTRGSDIALKYNSIKNNYMNKGTCRIYACNVCQNEFTSVTDLNKHKELCTEETRHSACPEKKSMEEMQYCCEVCNKCFFVEEQLATHFCFVDPTTFVCKICKKGFSKQYLLDIHVYSHSDEKPFNCDLCTRNFARRSDMIVHIRRTHKNHTLYYNNSGLYVV